MMYQQFAPIAPQEWERLKGLHGLVVFDKVNCGDRQTRKGYVIGHTGISNRAKVKTVDGREWERGLFSSTFYETLESKAHFASLVPTP